MIMDLKLYFGALSKKISEQVKKQLDYTDDTILKFDETADMITHLYLQGVLTQGEKAKVNRRLAKKITQHLNSTKIKGK